ncbi:MAG TPA: phosphoglycolate phosphatase [Firmicutes bacterium]|nr:phosphoglycolate phosphatase [Bacillota bacterium]
MSPNGTEPRRNINAEGRMGTYKLIALDLDGTLLNSKREISEQNLYWIKKAEEAGLIVSFATGRGRHSSEPYWGAVLPASPMIISNGAEVWKNHKELSSRNALSLAQVSRLIKLAEEHRVRYWTIKNFVDEETPEGDEFLKVGMYHSDLRLISRLRDLVASWGEFEVSASASNDIEINRKGINKATGLAEVTALLGIDPSEVVAIGDSLNDLAMIKWAGCGVAMDNAAEIIKEAADYVTGSNDEDGVARMIQLILE